MAYFFAATPEAHVDSQTLIYSNGEEMSSIYQGKVKKKLYIPEIFGQLAVCDETVGIF